MSDPILSDQPGKISIVSKERLYNGFRAVYNVCFQHEDLAFSPTIAPISREVGDIGPVAAVLPYDPIRDQIILLRQFRIAAQMATGRGEMIEIVAGLIDPGETAETTAYRETEEEAGVKVEKLQKITRFVASPGFATEYATLYCAKVDASQVPARTGLESEAEFIRPIVVDATSAVEAMDAGHFTNSYTIIALSWFARHHDQLREEWTIK